MFLVQVQQQCADSAIPYDEHHRRNPARAMKLPRQLNLILQRVWFYPDAVFKVNQQAYTP